MKLQNRPSAFANPIIASPEVIVAIRRLVQNACQHTEVRPMDDDGLRLECVDCSQQTVGVEVAQLVRAAR